MLPEDANKLFTIKVTKFNEHQTRKDVESMHWLRLSSNIMHDEKLRFCSVSTRLLHIYILALTARKAQRSDGRLTGELQTSVRGLTQESQMRSLEVRKGIEKLVSLGILSISKRNAGVLREKERKKEPFVNLSFDLELIYDAYPRKEKKAPGMMKLKKLIKDEAMYKKILSAAHAIKVHHERVGTEKKYIPAFATWVNGERWNDELTSDEPDKSKAWDEHYIF